MELGWADLLFDMTEHHFTGFLYTCLDSLFMRPWDFTSQLRHYAAAPERSRPARHPSMDYTLAGPSEAFQRGSHEDFPLPFVVVHGPTCLCRQWPPSPLPPSTPPTLPCPLVHPSLCPSHHPLQLTLSKHPISMLATAGRLICLHIDLLHAWNSLLRLKWEFSLLLVCVWVMVEVKPEGMCLCKCKEEEEKEEAREVYISTAPLYHQQRLPLHADWVFRLFSSHFSICHSGASGK